MYIIGLTGSFGTGKSTVAKMFAKEGAKIIDADAIVRTFLEDNKKCIKKVAKIFPDAILSSGNIDRLKLSKIVFNNPLKLKKLTDILYPEVFKEVKQQIIKYKNARLIVLDVPLLFEAKWDRLADTTVVVKSSREVQIKRLQKKMGLSKADILRRIKNQLSLKEKIALADAIIDNNGVLSKTYKQVAALVKVYLKRQKS